MAELQVTGERWQADSFLEELPQEQLGGGQHHRAHPDDRQLGQDGLAGLHLGRLNGPRGRGRVETINAESAETERGHTQGGHLTDK